MTIDDKRLKSCPFCGGDNVKTFGPYGWYRQWGISHSCKSFYSGTSDMFQGFATEAKAIAAWNTRPSALPADDAGLVADLEHMWHFPVPPGDKSARMYSETAKRAAEAISRREWQPIEMMPAGRCLMWVADGGFRAQGEVVFGTVHVYPDERSYRPDGYHGSCNVTHGMPLPTPPAASQPAGGGGE